MVRKYSRPTAHVPHFCPGMALPEESEAAPWRFPMVYGVPFLIPVAFSCGFLLWLSPVALVSLAVNTLKEPGRERGLLPFLYQSEHSY